MIWAFIDGIVILAGRPTDGKRSATSSLTGSSDRLRVASGLAGGEPGGPVRPRRLDQAGSAARPHGVHRQHRRDAASS